LNYYRDVGGLLADKYPFGYCMHKFDYCFYDGKMDYKFKSTRWYNKRDPKAFKEELQKGPMVVGVAACRDFMNYRRGVFSGCKGT